MSWPVTKSKTSVKFPECEGDKLSNFHDYNNVANNNNNNNNNIFKLKLSLCMT